MNKKLISLILAALLMFGGAAFGAVLPDLDNYIIDNGNSGPNGISPVTKIIKVRYSVQTGGSKAHESGINSTDCVAWDTTSLDGVSVVKMTASNKYAFAGVAVTPLATSDSGVLKANDKSWGYIAIRGWVLASIDATCNAGSRLTVADTGGLMSTDNSTLSFDVGVSLNTATGARDGMVYLQ